MPTIPLALHIPGRSHPKHFLVWTVFRWRKKVYVYYIPPHDSLADLLPVPMTLIELNIPYAFAYKLEERRRRK